MIFETHAHYDDEAFDGDREELLASLPGRGIGTVINVCADLASLETTPALTDKYAFVYGAVGLHPDHAGQMNEEVMDRLRRLCRREKTVAVGEIGLDYYWNKECKEVQIHWFERQLELAREEKLPVIIHSREAAEDTLETARRCRLAEIGGVLHCFSYSREMARQYLDMGVYLGIGGVVTFKNARRLREVVEYAPISHMLLETDSPYLAPEPNRGKRNSSLNLPYVAEEIGRLKGLDAEEVIAVTQENARRLFLAKRVDKQKESE